MNVFDVEEDIDSHICSGEPKIKCIYNNEKVFEKLVTPKLTGKSLANSRTKKLRKMERSKHGYCIQCVKGFKNRESFYEHINLKRCPNIKDNGQCMLCKQFFNSLDNLKDHVMTCFKDSLVSLLRPHSKTDHETNENINKRAVYHCARCNTLFPSIHTFRTHNKIKHNRKEKYNCVKCNFTCYSRALLKRHIKRRECPMVPSYPCFICDTNQIQYAAYGKFINFVNAY